MEKMNKLYKKKYRILLHHYIFATITILIGLLFLFQGKHKIDRAIGLSVLLGGFYAWGYYSCLLKSFLSKGSKKKIKEKKIWTLKN
jgi:hypothetical protein